MLHPSYHDLMSTVNREVEKGETPIVNSRYSIVLATSKRARQLIDGVEPLAKANCPTPLSIAIEELTESIFLVRRRQRKQICARRKGKARKRLWKRKCFRLQRKTNLTQLFEPLRHGG